MESALHSLAELFAQLGLDNDPQAIEGFIQQHKGLNARTALPDAAFWNHAQASFLREGLSDDSDWAELIDELDVRLR
ncbi:DUF2789 domain-containing protein [Gallaecimonas sp. GXIMD4217]|uniref:DUF2789 domain-containing protein n=1 Tax=Gallaecimonas sp. GXIMD4217 TaxID=3131927 RepID=UPI00311ABF98